MAMIIVKKSFFSAVMAFAPSPRGALLNGQGPLLHAGPQKRNADHTASHCEGFSQHFADKIVQIYSDLDAAVDAVQPPFALC